MTARLGRLGPGAALGVGAAAYAALFTFLSWRKQDDFEYGRFDLGNMAQTVWSTAHGRVLEMSDSFGEPFVRIGIHADPILVALAPLYRIWPDPKLLLVVQAVAVAAGAWPADRIARAELAGLAPASAAALAAGAYLLYPPLEWATLDEFHAVTLAAPLLLFAIWFLRERRYLAFALAAAAATLCKEEVGLIVAMLGLYAAFVWRDRRAGLIAAAAGAAWSALAFGVAIPHYSPSEAGPFSDRYDAVGGSVSGILKTLVTDPFRVIGEATSGRDLGYLLGLLAPLALLPLLAPAALVVAAPELAANLLSGQEAQTSWRFHYVAGEAAILWWAALLGLRRLLVKARDDRTAVAIPAALVCACLIAGYVMGPLPVWSKLPGGSSTRAGAYSPEPHDRAAQRAVDFLEDHAREDELISTSNRLGSHLPNHRRVAVLPETRGAVWVIADARNASYGERNAVARPTRRDVGREQATTLAALRDAGYEPAFAEGGVVVLRARSSRAARRPR